MGVEGGARPWKMGSSFSDSRVRCASFIEISAASWGWEQVLGMAHLVLGGRGKPGCPVPLPKVTVLIPVWGTHNCTDSVETALKISGNTTLRSSSVPKWIQNT